MAKDEDFNLLKIQTYILKVNIHCDGCKHKVKKLLQRIEGVYAVSIDAEQQQVTVSGSVDSPVLIKRLARSGKHAELWSSSKPTNNQTQKPNQQNQKQQPQPQQKAGNKSNKEQGKEGLMQGLKALKNQQGKLAASFSSDEEDNCEDDDDDLDEDDLRFLSDKMNQINLLKQASNAAAVKKNNAGGNGAGGKKCGVNPNQNMAKNLNEKAPKKGNVAGNPDGGEGKMNGLMGLGHHGLGGMNCIPANTGFPIPSNGGRFVGGHQQPQPMMMNNMQGHPAAMMNNLQRGQMNNMMMHDSIRYMQPQPQPQMMYNRSPQISPYIGYHPYYHYPCPNLNYQSETGDYGAHLFSDENTSGCVIM